MVRPAVQCRPQRCEVKGKLRGGTERMEFANTVRAELARAMPARRCCRQAELAAFVRYLGQPGEAGITVTSSNAAVARKVFLLGRKVPGGRAQMASSAVRPGRYGVNLKLAIPFAEEVAERDCCARAYLRGAWLSRGSVTEPDAGYHLEFAFTEEEHARTIRSLLSTYGVGAGVMRRKGDWVVYIKDADGIAELLRLTGAHGALLEWEDFRVLKHMRNRVNRLVNAETANVEKTVTAAVQQLRDIQLIKETMGLERLPPSLREMASLRLAHPDLSLRDLGNQLSPPLSKSAVNHRMRRLAQVAQNLRTGSAKRRSSAEPR